MDDKPDVRLVDPHAECVGCRDDPQLALDEAPLHALPGLGRKPGMEEIRRNSLLLQVFRHLLGISARGTVDDGTSGGVRRQIRHQDLVKMGELLASCGRHHHELQVRALGAAVENLQLDAELVAKMAGDVLHHVGLRGRG